jgi:Na+/proline symporter
VSIGLISFAAVAQFAPAMLGGMYWRGGTRAGAVAGLSSGFAVWLYTLLLPSFAKSGWLPGDFLQNGLFGLDLLRPQELFGMQGLDPLAHSLFWSMLANLGAYVWVSLMRQPTAIEAGQATLFVDVFKQGRPSDGASGGAAPGWAICCRCSAASWAGSARPMPSTTTPVRGA